MKTYLFHGASGSGKDTQVDLLVKDYDFEKIGTGEMLRALFDTGDPDALSAHEYWSKGLFVPNDLTYKMLTKWVQNYDSSKNWAFVSVVREVGQIPLFDSLLAKYNRVLDAFVHFTLSEEAAIERMSMRKICPICGTTYHEKYKPEKVAGICDKCKVPLVQREDDKPEKIKVRLQEYNRTIAPILEEYRKRGVLVEVDATPSIDVIHKEIIAKLNL